MGFPPAKGNGKPASTSPNGNPVQMNSTPTSTGKDLASSIRMKDAGIKETPGVDKTVNAF